MGILSEIFFMGSNYLLIHISTENIRNFFGAVYLIYCVKNINIRCWNHIFMSCVYPLLLRIYVKGEGGGGGGGIKHTTFVWQHVTGKLAIGLLIHVIWDICVNNQ
jgi:hypothetical protein